MLEALLAIWWVWVAIALILGIVEVLASGFIFLGFALGAVVTSGFVGLALVQSLHMAITVFAIASLLCWIGLRVLFRGQGSNARIVTRDINDD